MSIINNMVDLWNAVGTVFTGVKLNVTDTASDPASLLMDLQVGGASKFNVQKNGVVQGQSFRSLTIGSGETTINYSANGLQMGSICQVSWGNTPPAPDLFLVRDAANTLAQRNGTAAQTTRIYRSYTDVSNGSWLELNANFASAGIFSITAEGNGTGAASQPLLLGTNVTQPIYFRTNGSTRWTLDATGNFNAAADNSYDIGLVGASPRYVRAASAIQTKALTVATLPAAATALAGARSFVTDSSVVAAGNFGAIVAGAGANATPVYSDGSNWRIG